MGEPSTSKTTDAISQPFYQDQEKKSESSNQSEAIRQIEGLLGHEKESRQEVTCAPFSLTAYVPASDLCKLLIPQSVCKMGVV